MKIGQLERVARMQVYAAERKARRARADLATIKRLARALAREERRNALIREKYEREERERFAKTDVDGTIPVGPLDAE